jgi:hypothetical protein
MMRWFAMLVLTLFLGACDEQAMLQKFSSPGDQAEAKAWIAQLRARNFAPIERAMAPDANAQDVHAAFIAMAGLIPDGEPSSVKLVGAHVTKSDDSTVVDSVFEYQFGSKWFLIDVAKREQGTAKTIVAFHVMQLAGSLESQNRFSFSEKDLLHYAVLGAAIIAPLLTLVALVICVRTRGLRRKWLWVLFIVSGVGKFALNWSTGAFMFFPLSFQLFSAGAFAPLYGPWTISVSIPLGAIWFLVSRRKRAPAPVAA